MVPTPANLATETPGCNWASSSKLRPFRGKLTAQIVNLPLNGRSFDELAQLQPGVSVAKFAGVGTMQSGYTTKISIRGARPEQNSFLLDGTDVMGPTNQIPGSVAGQSFGVDE